MEIPHHAFDVPCSSGEAFNSQAREYERYAARYAWLRLNPAFETESVLSGVSPEEFDALVDKAMRSA